jgi:16S rRNA (guanine527-N7)-methyltransferase
MEADRIAELVSPFLRETPTIELTQALNAYLDLLLRWNRRLNLTAVRDEETIVIRHFGESLFAAEHWLAQATAEGAALTVADIGSGAGLPGIPLKLYAPQIKLTLVEAHGKKATFLREVVRALSLSGVAVVNRRAEELARESGASEQSSFELVTLRAVEQFDEILTVAAKLVGPAGRMGLLIGAAQVQRAKALLRGWEREEVVPIPLSNSRVVFTARRAA